MTRYDRLARETPGFEHWRMPVAAIVGSIGYLVLTVIAGIGVAIGVAIAGGSSRWLDETGSEVALDRPGILLVQLGSIVLMLPCVLGSVALVWRPHVRFLHSVEGRLRWGWLGRCLLISFAVVGVSLVLSVLVAWAGGESTGPRFPTGPALVSLVIVLLIVPFQAAAEEYVFRGGLLQLVGSWTRWAVVPVVVTSLLFAAGHLYNVWGLISVGLFGAVAAALTIRTGGLEAAIGLHVANNVTLMVFDLVGLVDSSEDGGPIEAVASTVMCLVAWGLIERSATRHQVVRRRSPLPEPARQVVVPPPPYVPPGDPVPGPQGASAPPPYVPPNAPSYPGDPGNWRR